MAEPSGWEGPPDIPGTSAAPRRASPILLASCAAFAGHVLVLIAAMTASLPLHTAIVAAVACAIIGVTALTAVGQTDARARRVIAGLVCGYVLAAVVMLLGTAPSIPYPVPLGGLAATVPLALVCLVTVRRVSTRKHQPRALTAPPRVAAIVLVIQSLVQQWAVSSSRLGLSLPLRAAVLFSIAGLGLALLASFSIVCLRLGPRWVIAGLLAWTTGWVANTATISSLALVALGRPLPTAALSLDSELVQITATLGGLVVGAALVTAIRDVRFRHSSVVLLVGFAIFGIIAAITQHRVELATDFPHIAALRADRARAEAIASLALAGLLWSYARRLASFPRVPSNDRGGTNLDRNSSRTM